MNKKQTEELKIKLIKEYDTLSDNLITNPYDLTRFVKLFTGGYHQYSMRNIILAWLQCPEMSLLAGYQDWQKKGRNVMKGQTGLRIFAPNTYKKVDDKTGDEEYGISGFRLAATFDVSQTGVAKTISTPDGKTFNILDPLDSTGLERGAEEYIQNPKNLKFKDFVENTIVPVNVKKGLGGAMGSTGGADINVVKKENEAAMLNTLFHEEMHIQLGHTNKDNHTAKEVEEVTAEAGAYLISTFFGIENTKSAYYIGHWKGDKQMLRGYGKQVIAAAEKVIKMHLPKEVSNNGKS